MREPAAGPGGAHSGAAAARRGSGSGGFVLRSREEGGGRRRRAQCVSRGAVLDPARAPRRGGGEVRGCGRRRRWRTRLPCACRRLGGLCRGLQPPLGAAQVGRGLRLSARSADGRGAGGRQEAGGGGARGEGAVERGAWGRAAAAPRRGGARGSRSPAARAHRARRRAASAARPPPSARLPLRALAPASPSGPQLRPPGPAHVTRSPAPRTEARAPCPAPAAGCRPPRLAVAHLSARGCAGPGDTAGGAPAAPSPALASSRSPPWEKLERGRGLGLDRRAPPDGVATVTGWHAKRFEVLTRLPVRPVPRESWFGGGDVPEEVLWGRLGRGLGEKFPPGREVR